MKLFNDGPSISSLLEVDAYKLTMGAFIWRHFPNLRVKFAFTNRNGDVPLGRYVNQNRLRVQLNDKLRELRFSEDELAYLRSWGIFPDEYFDALRELRLPRVNVLEGQDGQLIIETEGKWLATTFWETIILATVSEQYARAKMNELGMSQKELFSKLSERLDEKIAFMNEYPMPILQFGLRRRLSGSWEWYATERVLNETNGKGFAGVSNVALARELGVEPLGTNAHELPMALAALARHESDQAVRNAQYRVLELWEKLYGQKLMIMLPDAFGSQQFFAGLSREFAESFRGVRQDSGSPFAFAEELLNFYHRLGIDPKKKMIIFSDGLTLPKMKELYDKFACEFGSVSFGWGTNFTNDSGVIKPLSLVMKLSEAAGNPAVKLSDNLAKAVGDKAEVERYKRIFGYAGTFSEKPVY